MSSNQILEQIRALHNYNECMKYGDILSKKISSLLSNMDYDAITFSGGIDTTYLAYTSYSVIKKAKPLVYIKYVKKDIPLAIKELSSRINGELIVIDYNTDELLSVIKEVIKVMKSYHPVEVIETAVVYLGYLKLYNEYKLKRVVSGDGSDEVFYGYAYMIGMNPNELKEYSIKIIHRNYYPSKIINKIFNEEVMITPYLNNDIVDYGLSLPHEVKINTLNESIYGKFFMRVWLSEMIPDLAEMFWGSKQPIRSEAGIPIDIFSRLISPRSLASLMRQNDVILRSPVHAYLFKVFKELGFNVPGRSSRSKDSCPHCGSEIDKELLRCMTCGWWANIHGCYP